MSLRPPINRVLPRSVGGANSEEHPVTIVVSELDVRRQTVEVVGNFSGQILTQPVIECDTDIEVMFIQIRSISYSVEIRVLVLANQGSTESASEGVIQCTVDQCALLIVREVEHTDGCDVGRITSVPNTQLDIRSNGVVVGQTRIKERI